MMSRKGRLLDRGHGWPIGGSVVRLRGLFKVIPEALSEEAGLQCRRKSWSATAIEGVSLMSMFCGADKPDMKLRLLAREGVTRYCPSEKLVDSEHSSLQTAP